MKNWILFAMLMLISSTVYSQTESVKLVVIGNDTLNCLDQDQTTALLEELTHCDSYKDSLKVIVIKLEAADSLSHIDSLLIENYKKDLQLADSEIQQKDIQILSLKELNKICEKDRKRLKRKQWLVGLVSGGSGLLGGLLIGILAE